MRLKLLIGILGLVTGLTLIPLTPGWAQQIEITAPPPERAKPPEFVLPGQSPDVTRPREDDFRSDQDVRVRHDPAFIAPLTTTVVTGPKTGVRVGLSGWTAPPGRGDNSSAPEFSGVFAFGLSFAWPVQLEPEKPKPSLPAVR